jgi:hypothetical protein
MALPSPVPTHPPEALDDIEAFCRSHGFALIGGLLEPGTLAALDRECADARASGAPDGLEAEIADGIAAWLAA